MSKIELLWFDCKRCNKCFLSYVEGKALWNCHPDEDGICFDDENIGEIHLNHYLHAVKGARECRKCRKGLDIMSFGLHT